MDQQKVQAVLDWPLPQTVCAVRTFLRLAGYYHRFIQDYGTITTPLTSLLYKEAFRWGAEAEAAFHTLQCALPMTLELQVPNFNHGFIIKRDASRVGISVVLH
jgi:hypothetical protein